MLNLLGLPGLGSWLDGRRIAGLAQMTLTLTGFGLTSFWFVSFVRRLWATHAVPWDGGPHFRLGLLGLALFAGSWFWALGTSLSILRSAGKDSRW